MQRTISDDRSVGSLISDLYHKSTLLVRKEIQLGKAEMNEKVSQIGAGVGPLAVGGAVAFAGFLFLLGAAVLGLAAVWEPARIYPWLSPLIIGGVVALIGLIMVVKGRKNLKPHNLTPHRTAELVRRDRDFVKEQTK